MKPRLSILIVAILAASAALIGCGGHPRNGDKAPEKPAPVTADFAKNLDTIYSSPYVTNCETSRKDAIYAAARALDAFQNAVRSQAEPPLLVETKSYRSVRHGDFVVRELKFTPGTDPSAVNYRSWDDFLDDFREYGHSGDRAEMERLGRNLGGMLSDDLFRTARGLGYGVTPTNLDFISAMAVKARKCADLSICAIPDFTAEETAWLRNQPRYRELLDRLAPNSAIDVETRKKDRDSLAQEIGWATRGDFEKHRGIRFEGSKLVLQLDPGDFGFMREALEKYILPIWAGPGFELAIEWVTDPTDDLFRLVRDPGSLGRSFVRYRTREVHLFSQVRDRAIAHEIGHVLGFDDRYYDEWEPKNCRYVSRWDATDLMADDTTGFVKPDEFSTLRAQYGK
ncbi:MAG: hypothetical protein JST04_10420 [Bdellovibrionales bacterium]|nr:hypothetical protein [Bdellovibrionales bacterium]